MRERMKKQRCLQRCFVIKNRLDEQQVLVIDRNGFTTSGGAQCIPGVVVSVVGNEADVTVAERAHDSTARMQTASAHHAWIGCGRGRSTRHARLG